MNIEHAAQTQQKKSPTYFEVRNKYLSQGLAFLGFKYYLFNDPNNPNKKIYSFKDTPEITAAIYELNAMKKRINIQY